MEDVKEEPEASTKAPTPEAKTEAAMLDAIGEVEFAQLSSKEMLSVLRGKLVLWQGEFGRWGEK